MEKYKSLIGYFGFLFSGFGLYPTIIEPLIHVEKIITVTVDKDKVHFESNVNKEGDRYFILMGKDTVASGVVVNGVWK